MGSNDGDRSFGVTTKTDTDSDAQWCVRDCRDSIEQSTTLQVE